MPASSSVTTEPEHDGRSLVDRVFRNPDTGELAVVQVPNLPLLVFMAATGVRLAVRPEGTAGAVVSIVSAAALGVWAVDEIARGDSLFRRLLGAGVLVTTVAGLLTR